MIPEDKRKNFDLEDDTSFEVYFFEKDRRPFVVLTFLGLFLSLLFSFGAYRLIATALSDDQEQEDKISFTDTPEEDLNIQYRPINKIAYVEKNQLNVFDIKEEKKKELGNAENITALAWQNENNLSYSLCTSGSCVIKNLTLDENKTNEVENVRSGRIAAMRWSNNGQILAYLFEIEGKLSLSIRKGTVRKSLGSFSWEGDEVYDFNDALYIRFSPNGENIMIVNTFSKESVVVMNLNGEKIDSLTRQSNRTPSFAFFASNETIYFKKGEYLYVKNLGSEKDTKVTDRIVGAFGFTPSPDKSKLSYWTYDWPTGVTTLWVYEIGAENIKRFRDLQMMPLWINDNSIVSLSTENCYQCPLQKLECVSFHKADISTSVDAQLVKVKDLHIFAVNNI